MGSLNPDLVCGSSTIRAEFPVLSTVVQGHPLAHWDTAMATPIHRMTIAAWVKYCETIGVPADMSVHELGAQASDAVKTARQIVARFIGARESEVVFTKNSTEALRIVSFGLQLPKEAQVVIGEGEHYANLLNWVGQRQPIPVLLRHDSEGQLDLEHFRTLMNAKVGLVTFSLVNHITGAVAPIAEVVELAHAHGAMVLVDARQAIGRMPINVTELGCDFLVFASPHVYAPPGAGVLWGRREALEQLVFRLGSGAVRRVDAGGRFVIPADLPQRCEPGTKNAPVIAALGVAIEMMSQVGMTEVLAHEKWIATELVSALSGHPGIRVLGPTDPGKRVGIVSFAVEEGHRIMTCERLCGAMADTHGVICSGGALEGAPLLARMECADAMRLSGGVFTDEQDLRRVKESLHDLLLGAFA